MSHVSFSAATGSHVNLGHTASASMGNLGEPHHWWRALWSRRDGRVAEIRRLMQAQLEGLPDAPRHAALAAQIVAANQPETLWALRDGLMQALIQVHGEVLARQRMTDITFMFAGLLHRERPDSAGHTAPAHGTADWPSAPAARGLVRHPEQLHCDH